MSWAAQYNTWLLITLTPKGIVFSFLITNVTYWVMQDEEEVPQVQQRPVAAKSTTQIFLPILVRLVICIGAAFGSWRSYGSLPMMQLYHHQTDHSLGNTGEQPSSGW